MQIPIWRGGNRGGGGEIVAYSEVDDDCVGVAEFRWYLSGDGYATRMLPFAQTGYPRRSIAMHRQVMGLGHGDSDQIDHRNRNRLDNRRKNLRLMPIDGQAQNKRGGGRTSIYRGVYRAPSGRWYARAGNRHLGTFDTEQMAAAAAQEARLRTMPYALD